MLGKPLEQAAAMHALEPRLAGHHGLEQAAGHAPPPGLAVAEQPRVRRTARARPEQLARLCRPETIVLVLGQHAEARERAQDPEQRIGIGTGLGGQFGGRARPRGHVVGDPEPRHHIEHLRPVEP